MIGRKVVKTDPYKFVSLNDINIDKKIYVLISNGNIYKLNYAYNFKGQDGFCFIPLLKSNCYIIYHNELSSKSIEKAINDGQIVYELNDGFELTEFINNSFKFK